MKRKLTFLLAALLTLSLAVPAVAAEYTVKAGDSLSSIAQQQLGDSGRWQEIYDANKAAIKDPNLIVVGQKLTIPDGEKTGGMSLILGSQKPDNEVIAMATVAGFDGEQVTAILAIKDGALTQAGFTSDRKSDLSQKAIEQMSKAMTEKGTVSVDTVAGATGTSTAILAAARKAMAQITDQSGAGDLDAWALSNGYVKAADYDLVTGVDALTGASEKIEPEKQMTQEEIRALALDYLRGWPLKTDENGETVYSYREMYQIATSYNNVPGLSSVEFVLDPTTMKLYASSEKGTEKCEHIKHNPNVVMYWYHQIPEEEYVAYSNDYFNSYGVQIKGTAKIMDPDSEEAKRAADLYIETLYGAESWNSRPEEKKAATIAMLLKVNDWIEIDPTEYIVNSLLWTYNKENSTRPQYYDPESPFFGKSVRQVYYVQD